MTFRGKFAHRDNKNNVLLLIFILQVKGTTLDYQRLKRIFILTKILLKILHPLIKGTLLYYIIYFEYLVGHKFSYFSLFDPRKKKKKLR